MLLSNIVLAQTISNSWMYISLVAVVLYFGLILFCLMDVLKATFKDPVQKFIWIALILFFPVWGLLFTYLWAAKTK